MMETDEEILDGLAVAVVKAVEKLKGGC